MDLWTPVFDGFTGEQIFNICIFGTFLEYKVYQAVAIPAAEVTPPAAG